MMEPVSIHKVKLVPFGESDPALWLMDIREPKTNYVFFEF